MQNRELIIAQQRGILQRMIEIGLSIKDQFDRWADDFADPVIKYAGGLTELDLLEPIQNNVNPNSYGSKFPAMLAVIEYPLATSGLRRKKLSGFRNELLSLVSQFNLNADLLKLLEETTAETEKETKLSENPAVRSATDQKNWMIWAALVALALVLYRKFKAA